MRQHQPKGKEPEPKDNSLSDQFKELIQLVTIRELQAIRQDQQQSQNHYIEPPLNSSPIQSKTDHSKIFIQFFD